jgi:hypothetical protein
MKPSKEAVERAVAEFRSETWAAILTPQYLEDRISRMLESAILPGSCCHRECEWGPDESLVNQARFGLIPIE